MNDEFKIIEKFFKPLAKEANSAKNLTDDVAEISIQDGKKIVISKDLMVEDVHFIKSDGAFQIASKLLRSNLSDLAASGATPLYYMLGFSKNNFTDTKFIKEFVRGLKAIQKEFNIKLIGGDTVKAGDKLFFSITIFGKIDSKKSLSRNNAKQGDLIFVSGNIGDAGIGLKIKQQNKQKYNAEEKYFLNRHFFPEPRINLGKALIDLGLSKCAIDISDGLIADLQHICEESNLSARIFAEKIPLTKNATKYLPLSDLISAGDDYELIFTAKKSDTQKILKLAKELKINLTDIGYLEKKSTKKENQIKLINKNNINIKIVKYGYQH